MCQGGSEQLCGKLLDFKHCCSQLTASPDISMELEATGHKDGGLTFFNGTLKVLKELRLWLAFFDS